MRCFLLSTLVVTVLAMPAFAQGDDTARKIELAQQYSKLVPIDSEVDKTIEQLALQVPVDQRVLFKSILQRTIKADRLKAASELALSDLFTAKELEAMVTFYGTPEGQAIKDKMPDYQERLQPVLQQMVQDALVSLQSQMSAQ